MTRTYLDWNATAPLRPEARAAMLQAMDLLGNPSSVHAEGRAAKGLLERARTQVANAFGADGADIVFTSGATEAAAMALAGRGLAAAEIEHDAVLSWADTALSVSASGHVDVPNPERATLQLANSETGILQDLPPGLAVSDMTQAFGKVPLAFNWAGCDMALISAHKIGGPKGVGALVLKRGLDVSARIRGGGQEMGRRSGTENLVGIAGFGAAAAAAQRDLEAGAWERVEKLRNILEKALDSSAEDIIFVGKSARRLPNTTSIIVPGWRGETQVMQMDLAGFAISAGSACSSGKVKSSRVLRAMGFGDGAECAIRISIGPTTTKDEVLRFADVWADAHRKRKARAG
ncbi:cysteine desulfurase family protein [Tropicimonas marinistellae]|uniref:cysteine desulfurase family protein n=1 Tax=Tropicimonas marinistellae TaxID=1739787 RepID=UPI000835B66B|nr:aminotransferase class V-fold PLP-dependent enzyme [Tropicimonas marinistellae]